MSGEEEEKEEEARNKWFHINRRRIRRKMKGNKSVYVDAMAFFRKQGEGRLTLFVAWVGWGNSIRTNCRLGVKQKRERNCSRKRRSGNYFLFPFSPSLTFFSELLLIILLLHAAGEGKKLQISPTPARKKENSYLIIQEECGELEVPSAPKVIFTSDNEGKAKGRQKPKKTCDRKT